MGDETDEHPRNHGKQGIGEGGMKNGVHETTNHRTQSEHKPQQQTIFSAQQDAADNDGNVERRDGSNLSNRDVTCLGNESKGGNQSDENGCKYQRTDSFIYQSSFHVFLLFGPLRVP